MSSSKPGETFNELLNTLWKVMQNSAITGLKTEEGTAEEMNGMGKRELVSGR